MAKGAPGFFDVNERLAGLSAKGDDLKRVKAPVDSEMFRAALEAAVPRGDRSKRGRPRFEDVLMLKVLFLRAMQSLSDERSGYLIKERQSVHALPRFGFGRCGFRCHTIPTFRNALKKVNAVDAMFQHFDAALREAGFLAMSGQIVDPRFSLHPGSAKRMTRRKAIKEGRIPQGLEGRAKKARPKGSRCVREWSLAKAQFAIRFGERLTRDNGPNIFNRPGYTPKF